VASTFRRVHGAPFSTRARRDFFQRVHGTTFDRARGTTMAEEPRSTAQRHLASTAAAGRRKHRVGNEPSMASVVALCRHGPRRHRHVAGTPLCAAGVIGWLASVAARAHLGLLPDSRNHPSSNTL
jgi:hypothetical protein